MSLKEKIRNDLKASMKSQDKISLAVLRMLNSDIRNKEIDLMKEIDDEEVIRIIRSNLKKRKDAIELYKKGNRQDLVSREESEAVILERYLPKQMDEEALREIVRSVIKKTGLNKPSDFGGVMKEAMKEIKGGADGKVVSDIVKKELNKTE